MARDNKPSCKLTGEDGNIFNLLGIAGRVLKENDMQEEAGEMRNKVYECRSYDEALAVIGEYVDIV